MASGSSLPPESAQTPQLGTEIAGPPAQADAGARGPAERARRRGAAPGVE